MVYEFPELQGVMGRYYALAAGHDDGVPEACEEHYAPLGPSDAVPTAPVSVSVALAEKLDTLTCFWSIGETPTGSRDPFALRRAALGVIRIVLENRLRLPLAPLLARADGTPTAPEPAPATDLVVAEEVAAAHARFLAETEHAGPGAAADLLGFFHERLKVHLRDAGIPHDVIDACMAMPGTDDLALLVRRAEALAAVLGTDDGVNLIQGFRRANNILAQAEEKDGVEYSFGADVKFAETEEERALFAALDAAEAAIAPALGAEAFEEAMEAMAGLRRPIDAFFEAVQINADNAILRRNRLNLLSRIRTICLSVADLSRIEG